MYKLIARHSFIYGLAQLLNVAIGFILVPLYTRSFTLNEYGIVALLTTIVTILGYVCDFGFTSGLTREFYEQNGTSRKQLIATAFTTQTVIAAAIILFLYSQSRAFGELLFNSDSYQYDNLLKLMLLNAFSVTINSLPLLVLRLQRKSILYNIVLILKSILLFGSNIILILYLHHGLSSFFMSAIIADFIVFIFVFIMDFRKQIVLIYSLLLIKPVLRYGLPFIPVLLASWLQNLSDRFLLQHFSYTQQLGIYAVGYKLGMVISTMYSLFNIAWNPIFLEKYKTIESKRYNELYLMMSLIMLYGSVVLSMFAQEIIALISTADYTNAKYIVPFISLAQTFNGMYCMFLTGLTITKKSISQLYIVCISALINVGFNLVAIPAWGMYGAAIGICISYAIMAILTVNVANRYYYISYEFWKPLLIIALFTALYIMASFTENYVRGSMIIPIKVFFLLISAILIAKSQYLPMELKKRIVDSVYSIGKILKVHVKGE